MGLLVPFQMQLGWSRRALWSSCLQGCCLGKFVPQVSSAKGRISGAMKGDVVSFYFQCAALEMSQPISQLTCGSVYGAQPSSSKIGWSCSCKCREDALRTGVRWPHGLGPRSFVAVHQCVGGGSGFRDALGSSLLRCFPRDKLGAVCVPAAVLASWEWMPRCPWLSPVSKLFSPLFPESSHLFLCVWAKCLFFFL